MVNEVAAHALLNVIYIIVLYNKIVFMNVFYVGLVLF